MRPATQPAQRLYDALLDEAAKRPQYADPDGWITGERRRLLSECNAYAAENGLPAISEEHVERAEAYAVGHTDYASKLAYQLADVLRSLKVTA